MLAAQLRPPLCKPMYCSPPGCSVHGDSPGKNTGEGCHFLLQGIFPTQASNLGLLHCRQILYQLSHQGSSNIYTIIYKIDQSVQFNCSVMSDSATPWTAAQQPSLSFTISWSLLKLMSIESVMPSTHLILCRPLFLLPSIFPSIRVFSNVLALCIKWPNIEASASASVLPVNIQG